MLLVFNLSNGIDVEETKRKVDEYISENRKSIDENRRKLVLVYETYIPL